MKRATIEFNCNVLSILQCFVKNRLSPGNTTMQGLCPTWSVTVVNNKNLAKKSAKKIRRLQPVFAWHLLLHCTTKSSNTCGAHNFDSRSERTSLSKIFYTIQKFSGLEIETSNQPKQVIRDSKQDLLHDYPKSSRREMFSAAFSTVLFVSKRDAVKKKGEENLSLLFVQRTSGQFEPPQNTAFWHETAAQSLEEMAKNNCSKEQRYFTQ